VGPDGVTNAGTIVPRTGTGELAGIKGDAAMLADEDGNLARWITSSADRRSLPRR
jgi:Protein of unknown function (DUF3224)